MRNSCTRARSLTRDQVPRIFVATLVWVEALDGCPVPT
jgi:hypothetical protein